MRLFQKISAGVLITFSLMITVLAIADIANPHAKNKDGAFGALIVLGLPPGALGGFLVWNVLRTERKEKEALAKQESDRLQSIFYLLLKNHGGEITSLLFSMETKLSADESKAYLDQKAKEFDANFDVDENGGITYRFNIGRSIGSKSP